MPMALRWRQAWRTGKAGSWPMPFRMYLRAGGGDRRSGKGEERVGGCVGLDEGQMDAAWRRKRQAAGAAVIRAVGAPLPFHTFHINHTFPRISPTLFSP